MNRNDKRSRQIGWFLTLAALAVLLPFIKTEPDPCNGRSRLAAAESLVERGTFVIDDSPFAGTCDKVFIKGKFYSDKPPALSVLTAGWYWFLKQVGVTFGAHPRLAYYLITLLITTAPAAIIVFLLYRLFLRLPLPPPLSALLAGGGLISTALLPYSLTYNNHLPAAAALLGSFFLLTQKGGVASRERLRVFLSGLLGGLAAAIDFSALAFLAGFAVLLLYKRRVRLPPHQKAPGVNPGMNGVASRSASPKATGVSPWCGGLFPMFLLGILPFIIAHFSFNYAVTGDFLPINLHTEYFDFPGSMFAGADNPELTGWFKHQSASRFAVYTIKSLISFRGLFSHNPALILALIYGIKELRKKPSPFRSETLLILSGSAVVVLTYLLFSTNYSGWAYGIRWHIIFIPLLYYCLGFGFLNRSRTMGGLVLLLLIIFGTITSILGAIDPYVPVTNDFGFSHNLKKLLGR